MVLPIKLYPEAIKILTARCATVGAIDEQVKIRARNLIDTAVAQKNPPAAGLAAPQLGYSVRMAVVRDDGWRVMINPVFRPAAETPLVRRLEGCLSLPGLEVEIARYESGSVDYTDLEGESVRWPVAGFDACCVQHEIDHLDGILLIHPERLSSLRRQLALQKYANLRGLRFK